MDDIQKSKIMKAKANSSMKPSLMTPADPGIDPNFQYPEPAFKFERIIDDKVKRAIRKLSPYKAPGPNEISNSILTHCADKLTSFIGPIYQGTFNHKHYPKKWKQYTTVVL